MRTGALRVLAALAFAGAAAAAPPQRSGAEADAAQAGCAAHRGPVETARPTVEVTPGEHYQASRPHRLLFGEDYRKVWATPVRVPVLDPRTYDGGLLARQKGGGKQSLTLELESRAGREYRFRSVDKDPAKVLPRALRGTPAADVVRDQTAAVLPAGSLVVGSLLDRVGILNAKTPLFVMADDESLGEFRREFGGMLGTLEVVPEAGRLAPPGFEGVSEVLSSEKLLERQLEQPNERFDARAFLRARLVDLLVGDWDRHHGQWRWGRPRSGGAWLPIPRDRDQAFAKFEGLVLGGARLWAPRLVVFGPDYPSLKALAWNSRDFDRRLLAPLSWADWEQAVAEVQRALADPAPAAAVCELPAEHYRLVGPQLVAALRARRAGLPRAAREFYRLLAEQADVFATEGADVAQVERRADGGVRLRIADPGAAEPWFDRTFEPRDTREVRLYLEGGDDRLRSAGSGPRKVKVRVVGGLGDDTFDDTARAGLRLYDSSGENQVRDGGGTRIDSRPWVPPVDDPDVRPLDWGKDRVPLPWVSYYRDVGALVGLGVQLRSYGFRRYPHAISHTLRAGYATSAGAWRFEYLGDFRRRGAFEPRAEVVAVASGFEVLRFYGFGNEQPAEGPDRRYQVGQRQYVLAPALVRGVAGGNLSFGPVFRFASTRLEQGRLVSELQPYGSGDFGQLGARVGYSLDRRERPDAPRHGLLLDVRGSVYPPLWSVDGTFGRARATVASYLPLPLSASLAVRAGGQKVWGRYPFHDAAFIGSWDTVRGLPHDRYAGDAAVFGNAELRLPLSRLELFYAGRLGVFALADVGRVYLQGESSDRWHHAWGGGAWLAFENGRRTFSAAVATSEGNLGFYLHGGLLF